MSVRGTFFVAMVVGFSLGSLSAVGCGKKGEDAPASKGEGGSEAKEAAQEPQDKPVKKDLATLLQGKAPTIPSVLKGLRPGMTAKEYKAIFPGMPDKDDIEVEGYDTTFNVMFDQDSKKLASLYFGLPKDKALDMVSKAWGKPIATKDDIDRPQQRWFNPKTGVRAVLQEGYGDDMRLEFSAYMPAEKLLGAKPGPTFAFESKQPVLGATVEQLRKAYPGAIVEKREEGGQSVYLDLLPTEYGDYWTRVNMTFDDAGKVRRFWFSIPFEANPAFKEPLFKLIQAKVGKLTQGKDIVGDVLFTFQDAKRRVEVKEDTISHAWSITVEPPEKKG